MSQSNMYAMSTAQITIRPAYADDQSALFTLAALDSAEVPPPSPLLLAEVDGKLRAALSLRDGSTIADPFVATASIVALLKGHARQTQLARSQSRRRRLGRRLALRTA